MIHYTNIFYDFYDKVVNIFSSSKSNISVVYDQPD